MVNNGLKWEVRYIYILFDGYKNDVGDESIFFCLAAYVSCSDEFHATEIDLNVERYPPLLPVLAPACCV